MRFFRSIPRAVPVALFLHHLEHGRFEEARKALERRGDGPAPPPHALWRLGRGLLGQGRAREARLPLELFRDLYPRHLDRPAVMRDLAAASKEPPAGAAVAAGRRAGR
jgi:hypothetical protein